MLNVYLFAIGWKWRRYRWIQTEDAAKWKRKNCELYRRIATTYWILNDVSSYVTRAKVDGTETIAAQQVCALNKIRMKWMRWVGFHFGRMQM